MESTSAGRASSKGGTIKYDVVYFQKRQDRNAASESFKQHKLFGVDMPPKKKPAAKKKSKSRVNEAGNYTKPSMRKSLFNKIKAGSKGGKPGQWSARKAQMLAKQYKAKGGGYKS